MGPRSWDSVMFFNMNNGVVDAKPFHEMEVPVGIVSVTISPCGVTSNLCE
jgi:hypothetical protein